MNIKYNMIKMKLSLLITILLVTFSISADVKSNNDKLTLSWRLFPLTYSDSNDYFWAISSTNLLRLCRFYKEGSPKNETMECGKSTSIAAHGIPVSAWALPARLASHDNNPYSVSKRILLQIAHPRNGTTYRNCRAHKNEIRSGTAPQCSSNQLMPTP